MNAPEQVQRPPPPVELKSMNLYQRINEVRKKVPYLQKLKRVEGSGYLAVTHDQVTGELRQHLIDHGIVIVPPSVTKSEVKDTGTKTAKGIPFIRYEATYRIVFVNADEPQDQLLVTIEAHAIDQGDKAPGKAMSYAKKYALLKLFEIETGEEEEERPRDEQGGMPAKEYADWESAIDALAEGGAAAEALWQKIVKACEDHDDRPAATKLKARITAKLNHIKKNGAAAK